MRAPHETAAKSRRSPRASDPTRWLRPRLWDPDWPLRRKLVQTLAAIVERVVGDESHVLDFGCGSKPYQKLFASRARGYAGIDYRDADYGIDAAGRTDAPSDCADVLLSIQVLEHVRELDVYFGEAHRLLRENGTLVLSTHGHWLYHPEPEDHRRWTREGLLHELSAHGFDTSECIALVGPLATMTMLRAVGVEYMLRDTPIIGRPLAALFATLSNLVSVVEDRLTPEWVLADNACVYVTISKKRA